MKLLLPCYDPSLFSQVLAHAKRKPMAVILNPNEGPGGKVSEAWLKFSKDLRAAGCDLYGYIDLVRWDGKKAIPRDANGVGFQADCWQKFYKIGNYFYDDWREGETTQALVNRGSSIANPGCDVATNCRTTVIWEAEKYLRSKPTELYRPKGSQAVLAMAEADYRPALELARKRKVDFFHCITAGDNSKAWDKLPEYFGHLLDEI